LSRTDIGLSFVLSKRFQPLSLEEIHQPIVEMAFNASIIEA
jgi:hypothetical protein